MKKKTEILKYSAITLFIILSLLYWFSSPARSDYIDNYPPDSPWILNPEGVRVLKVDPDGAIRVRNQDQTTPSIIIYANQSTNTTTLTVATALDDRTITVDDPTGIVVTPVVDRSYIGIFDLTSGQYYAGFATAINGSIVTLDTPLSGAFAIGSPIGISIKNMAVNGAVTPQVFSLRASVPGLPVTGDITRFMIFCVTTTAVDLTDFGDIPGGLNNGIVIRKLVDSNSAINLINFHSNIEMKGIMFDWVSLDDSNPGQGLHGFSGRFTIAKLGSVMRIGPGEIIEVIVQDDLSSLLELYIIPEGSLAIP